MQPRAFPMRDAGNAARTGWPHAPAASPALAAIALLAASLIVTNRPHAQELEPRAYGNAPVGLNFIVAGFGHSEGGVVVDPSIPLTNADIEIHSGVLAYARSLGVAGRSAKFDIVLPYATLSGTAEVAGQPREREVSGWGDPRLRFSVNLYGAPAMTLKEIAGWRQDLIVGVSLHAWVPTGQYDADKLVNIGTNRWVVKPEIGVSKVWGRWTLELAGAVAILGDNDNFFGGQMREQDPVYSAQGGIVYSFRSGVWIALSSTYYTGGRTTVDGIEGDDLLENSRLGATLTLPVDRNNSIKVYANTGVSTRTGTDFDAAGIAWQYRWGGGL